MTMLVWWINKLALALFIVSFKVYQQPGVYQISQVYFSQSDLLSLDLVQISQTNWNKPGLFGKLVLWNSPQFVFIYLVCEYLVDNIATLVCMCAINRLYVI